MAQIKSIAIFIIIGLLCGACGSSQEKSGMNALEQFFPAAFENYVPADTLELYDYDGIFRYINGAGEVYRMYDYRQVAVRKYAAPNLPDITVEIFDMGKPEDAFGIFLHSSSGPAAPVGTGACLAGGYLLFWQNRYFVNIYAAENIPEIEPILIGAGNLVAAKIPTEGSEPEIIKYLPTENRIENSTRFFHTHTALNYQYYLSPDNILELNDSTDAVLARFTEDLIFVLLIQYENDNKAESAVGSFISAYIPEADDGLYEIESEKFCAIKQHDKFVIVIFEAATEENCHDLFSRITALLPQ